MSNKRIMIVEDEWAIANDIQKCLKNSGYTVSSVVPSGVKAIQKAKEDKPDLILMDIVLRGEMDGIEAANQINKYFNIPIIYLTAYNTQAGLERAKLTEPFGYLIKPFEDRELHCTIEMAFYKHKMEKERKRLLTELNYKNIELQQIIYTVSHDLRSPLVNIQGYSKELEQTFKEMHDVMNSSDSIADVKQKLAHTLKEDIPDALKYILKSTSKINSLLSSFLQVSCLGRVELTIKQLDMDKLISDVVENFKHKAREIGVSLHFEELPPCMGDDAQINQVFSNLVDNAIKYLDNKRPGIIKISGLKEDKRSIYCVEDNGIGIAVDCKDKIFEIFHRIKPGDSDGDGLGLTIIRKILDRHEGSIWVESEPGNGSRFFVSLPG